MNKRRAVFLLLTLILLLTLVSPVFAGAPAGPNLKMYCVLREGASIEGPSIPAPPKAIAEFASHCTIVLGGHPIVK